MKPFIVKGYLKSPVVIGQRSPNLAGILFHCCFLHTSCEDEAGQLLSSILKLTDGVYHASDMLFGVNVHQNLIASQYSTVGVMNSYSDLTEAHIKPNGCNGKYSKVKVEGGPSKARLNTHKAYFAKSVIFHGLGDVDKIIKLIEYYIPAVGLFSNGKVDDWQIQEIDSDQSFYIPKPQGGATLINRIPIDSDLLQHPYDVSEVVSLSPPFYRSKLQGECALPKRINKILDV